MRKALVYLAVFMSTATAFADSQALTCEKVTAPPEKENQTQSEIYEYQIYYGFTERIQILYSGVRMRFKTPEELVDHQKEMSKIINETITFFGYDVTTEEVLNCSNKNSKNIDFTLLRFAVFQSLKNFYSF